MHKILNLQYYSVIDRKSLHKENKAYTTVLEDNANCESLHEYKEVVRDSKFAGNSSPVTIFYHIVKELLHLACN